MRFSLPFLTLIITTVFRTTAAAENSETGPIISGTVLDYSTGGGINGATIKLVDSDNNEVATEMTDTNGVFSFQRVTPGVYLLKETNANGFPLDVEDSDGEDPNRIRVDVTEGNSLGNTFTDSQARQISGYVKDDNNVNGIMDESDRGNAGVAVALLKRNGSPMATTSTDTDGAFHFDLILPGTYTLAETNARMCGFVADSDGGDAAMDGYGRISVDVSSEDSVGNWFLDRLCTWEGYVMEDTDNDGTGDVPMAGVTIELDGPLEVRYTVTDEGGHFVFTDLLTSAHYDAKQITPTGFVCVGQDTIDAGVQDPPHTFVNKKEVSDDGPPSPTPPSAPTGGRGGGRKRALGAAAVPSPAPVTTDEDVQ